jgi:hypothetical protein
VGIRDGHANDEVQSISPSDLSTGPSISLVAAWSICSLMIDVVFTSPLSSYAHSSTRPAVTLM